MRLYKHSTRPKRGDQYQAAWVQLRENEKITLELHRSQLHAVHNGIQKMKCYQNVIRRRLGLPGYGLMKSKIEDHPSREGFILLHLSITFNGDKL